MQLWSGDPDKREMLWDEATMEGAVATGGAGLADLCLCTMAGSSALVWLSWQSLASIVAYTFRPHAISPSQAS